MTGPRPDSRPLTLVFCLAHAGFIRHYRSVLELLAARGHRVHVAFSSMEKDAGDARRAEELAARHEGLTIGLAPQRDDAWRAPAGLARSLVDLARYAGPRYADAPELRARAAREVSDRVRSGRGAGRLRVAFGLRLVRWVAVRSPPASRRLIRVLAAAERVVPTSGRIDRWLGELRADAVLVSPVVDFGSSQVEYVKSARALGVPSAVCVASWDNLTGKGLIRVLPDRVFVWNETQRREAVELHGIPAERVITTGSPKFDEWFERRPATAPAEFRAKVGLRADRPYVLYLCSSPFIAPDESGFVRDWITELRGAPDGRLRGLGVLVRPHPQNAFQWRDVDLSPLGDVAMWPREGAQPDAGEARADFFDSLFHSAAVVGVNTSALIEAAIVGRSVFTVLDPRFAGTQPGTLHFHYLRHANGGFLHEADSFGEHLAQLAAVLESPEENARTRRFVASFVRPHGLERAAASILADEIEELALA